MQRELSHDRTMRMLAARLEAIALASERSPAHGAALEPHVQRAAAATRNAVRLELITGTEAGAIWASVARRHPGVRWAAQGPSLSA